MPRLIWTPPALVDVQRLHRFLATEDESSARRAVKTIRTGVKILAHQPMIGRSMEDMDPGFREWPISFGGNGYVVLYRFDGETVAILAVRHQREGGY